MYSESSIKKEFLSSFRRSSDCGHVSDIILFF